MPAGPMAATSPDAVTISDGRSANSGEGFDRHCLTPLGPDHWYALRPLADRRHIALHGDLPDHSTRPRLSGGSGPAKWPDEGCANVADRRGRCLASEGTSGGSRTLRPCRSARRKGLARLMSKPPAMSGHRHRPPAKTLATEAPKTIVTAKRPRKQHYGQIETILPIRRTTKQRRNAPGRSSSVG
jgi:hypothetical protein